ncbi:threonine aldolase family protein [Rhizosaccharibacter radicis]|uniref:L-threonine aldolase n=1 Tax=Rhizosaccharibacter radicis TaxID=2782605 RepID=A0ABT1W0K3_9PROT|nr:beta-eliminating lyase-related protein [Acetobacteraceae bacterium KSS12]
MSEIRKNFGSDNVSPACAEIMAALMEANRGAVPSYGADGWTTALEAELRRVFEHGELVMFPVATGTAANALALSALVPPFGAVYCDEAAHIHNDECGAPEFYTSGAKLLTLPSENGKLSAPALEAHVAAGRTLGVHKSRPYALSLTQATEWGTVYAVDEIRALAACAHRLGLATHMDGARFANALVHLGCTPAEMTWKAGIDVLCFGATKNGALAAEAVIFFQPRMAEEFARRRKRAGQLWSKARFLSAQITAFLADDLWLRNARAANAAATRLADGLTRLPGARLLQPVQANELFALLPEAVAARLEAAGFGFYRWYMPGMAPTPEGMVPVRMVTAWDVRPEDVDALLAAAGG